jgi:hypothetical protein
MKLSFKNILPILLIFTLLILLAGCGTTPSDEQPGYTPGTITGIIAAPCCSTSADPVTDPCCIAPEYWCYDCENTWSLQDNIKVVLTYGEDEVATTTTNEDGEYIFTNVPPGKNYVITAFCPDYNDDRPLVKDVALEVVEGETFDAKITDCVSTSLGLVVDFLVTYTELGPEEIVLDEVIAGNPNFWGFPRFKKLVLEVCRAEGECVNLNTDEDVQDALCKAAEEVGQIVLPDLDLGCAPGYTLVGGEGEGECAVPIADAGGPYSDTVCPGTENKGILPVALIDLVGFGTGTGTLSYAWDLDADGLFDDSAEQNPQDVAFGVGVHTVTLGVTDYCGSAIDEMIVIITECINHAPTITPISDKNIAQGNTLHFTVSANDLDVDNLFYEIVSGPSTMTINSNTGAITWVAACSDPVTSRCHIICSKEVTVKVTDDGCCPLSAQDTFIINVWDQLP